MIRLQADSSGEHGSKYYFVSESRTDGKTEGTDMSFEKLNRKRSLKLLKMLLE
jgi:hypothetical protein